MIMTNSNTVVSSPVNTYDALVSNSYDQRYRSHSPLQSPTPSIKSQSIPISEGLYRTASEIQLCQDEEVADQRDYAFYSRVVSGISQSQCQSKSWHLKRENHMCLLHIMQTRNNGAKHEDDDDDWALGRSLEQSLDDQLVHSIASEAVALTTSPDDEEGMETCRRI